MLTIKALSILTVAGTAAALPQWGNFLGTGAYFSGPRGNGDNAAATALEIVTQYATVTVAGNYKGNGNHEGGHRSSESTAAVATPSPAPVVSSAAPVAPVASSFFMTFAAPSPAASPVSVAPVAPAASSSAPAVASSTPVASSGSSDGGYMAIVNKWRGKLGMSDLTEDDTLQGNALKTVTDDKGQMTHELNPGSFAQVLAPGSADDFEKVFVGGWLCEISTLPGLDGICDTMSQGWAYDGQTGHAEILTSKAYSKIGCALNFGIWGCDLA